MSLPACHYNGTILPSSMLSRRVRLRMRSSRVVDRRVGALLSDSCINSLLLRTSVLRPPFAGPRRAPLGSIDHQFSDALLTRWAILISCQSSRVSATEAAAGSSMPSNPRSYYSPVSTDGERWQCLSSLHISSRAVAIPRRSGAAAVHVDVGLTVKVKGKGPYT